MWENDYNENCMGETEEVIRLFNEILEKYRRETAELKRENRTYRESITSISHDIRTPLTSAKGYLQMLSGEDVPREKQQEYRKTVENRVDDVTGMLNQLFEYARVEAGELEFTMERIFERFYTTDTSRTRKTTGLGLAIVKQFVTRMEGEVQAALTDGIFTVEIVFPCPEEK